MKRLIVIAFLITCFGRVVLASEQASDGATNLPSQGVQVGGKGADGKFHFLLLGNDGSMGGASVSQAGATNIAFSQVTSSGSPATLAVARPTRRSVTFKNLDATNTVTIGSATVSTSGSTGGMPLKAGESISVRWVGLIQFIANAGTPIVSVMDEYD